MAHLPMQLPIKVLLVMHCVALTEYWFHLNGDSIKLADIADETGVRDAPGNDDDEVELGGHTFFKHAENAQLIEFIKKVHAGIETTLQKRLTDEA